jgi:hypothetical protein
MAEPPQLSDGPGVDLDWSRRVPLEERQVSFVVEAAGPAPPRPTGSLAHPALDKTACFRSL